MQPASSHGTDGNGASGGKKKDPLTPDQAATRIQAAFRGYKARNLPVHPMKFVTWRNTTNPKQAEHMTVKFGSGGSGTARYVDFRQGTGDRHDIAPLEGVQNLLTGSSAASSIPPSKPFQNLAYGEHTPSEHRARFLARPSLPSDQKTGRDFRYDSREYVRAKVTFKELRALHRTVEERKKDGVFHLFGEASGKEPMTTRCMTMIETLANLRGMPLANANTSAMALQFHTLNEQSRKFSGTTTAPKLRRYEVLGAPRTSSEEVTKTAAVRKSDVSKLDVGYWKHHEAGAHNVGRPIGKSLL